MYTIKSCHCSILHVHVFLCSVIISALTLSRAKTGMMSRLRLCLPIGKLEKLLSIGLREQVNFLLLSYTIVL